MRKLWHALSLSTAAIALSVSLGGCTEQSASTSTEATSERPMILTLAHGLSETHTVHIAISEFAKELDERTNGRIKVRIFANGQLGSELEQMEQVMAGVISMTKVASPMFYEFEHDLQALNDRNLTFMFGSYVLVANVLEKGQRQRPIYLPSGHTWYDMNDNYKAYEGGQTIYYEVDDDSIPMFLKDEAILIASKDIKRIVFDKVKTLDITVAATKPLTAAATGLTSAEQLLKYQSEHNQGTFYFDYYEDDGHTKDFEKGVYANTRISVSTGEVMEINFKKTGSYEHSYQKLNLTVLSPFKGALYVSCAGVQLKRYLVPDEFDKAESGWYYNLSSRTIQIKCDRAKSDDYSIIVSTKNFDLIGMENNG